MLRVLIADDCRKTADMFAELLAAWGYRAEVAYDGAEALAKARAVPPDVALLDLAMPGLTGAEVARRLHRPGASRPWLFVVTGLDSSALPREDAAVFHSRLTKPVQPGDLLALLQAAEAAGKGAE